MRTSYTRTKLNANFREIMETPPEQLKLYFFRFADSELNECGSLRPEETNVADDNPETPTTQQEMKVENLDYSYYSDGTSQSEFGGRGRSN